MNPWVKAVLASIGVALAGVVVLLTFTYLMVRAPLVLAALLAAIFITVVRYAAFGDE